ncbi:MAG: hypothetical protein M3388_06175 [Acidobacteriota bacterium]|nr:hypothetical protein [Acidobacteriota bacterium]
MKNLFLSLLLILFCGCNLQEDTEKPSENNSANISVNYSRSEINNAQNIITNEISKSASRKTGVFECDELLELLANRIKQHSDSEEKIGYENRARDYKTKEEVVNQMLFDELKAHKNIKTPQEKEKLIKICEAAKKVVDAPPIKDL